MIRYIKENPHCHKCKHCENEHLIDDLNGKLDEYFCTLSCRIAKHISDLDIHVTKEKKDYWDAKAEQSSVDALDDNIKNTLDELNQFKDQFGDINNFVKRGDLEGFATKDFVETYVQSVIKGYATKEYVNNQINKWFDKSNYYTKSQIDSLLNKNYSNYSITSLDYADGILTIKQNNIGNTKSVNIGTSNGNVPGGGSISQEAFDDMLKASKTIHTLNINNKSYNPVVSDVNMTITGGSGSESGGYYKPYFKNTTYYDSFPRSEMPTDGSAPKSDSGWSDQQKNPNSGQYTWMTQVFIDTAGNYGSYMDAIRLTGENGSDGEDGSFYEYIYRRQNQNQVLPIKPDNKQQDNYIPSGWNNHPEGIDQYNRYEYVCYRIEDKSTSQWGNWFGPYLWSAYGENGTDGDGVEYIYYVGLTKPTGNLQDPSKWDTSVSDFQDNGYVFENSGWTDNPTDLTEQGQKQYVSVRKKHDNVWEAYSEPALWSYYSVDGESSQTSVGSPLRMVGEWISGRKYYDGKRATSDGIFYQDVVLYNNTYYACVDTEEGERSNWVTTPDKAQYFSAFSLTTDQMVKLLIANKAFIKELSSNEVVIMDDDTIVAGMTSSKSIDSKSDLNGKVTNKGDVRIWAGKMQTNGDLTTAYTTIGSNGSIIMQNIQQGKSIKLNPQECSFKIIGPVRVTYDSYANGTYIPSSDERIELANFEYTIDPDTLYSAIRLVMESGNGRITIDPIDKEIYVYSSKYSSGGSSIRSESIDMYDANGDLYTSFNGIDIAGRDFVTLTSRYNKKGLHLYRGTEKYINNIIYTLEGLPTSDPKINGALYRDQAGNLKISLG